MTVACDHAVQSPGYVLCFSGHELLYNRNSDQYSQPRKSRVKATRRLHEELVVHEEMYADRRLEKQDARSTSQGNGAILT
jgi:hypothetical protein